MTRSLKTYKRILRGLRIWLGITLAIHLVWVLLGTQFVLADPSLLEQTLTGINDELQLNEFFGRPAAEQAVDLFLNNIRVALGSLFGGVLLAGPTVVVIVVNGLLEGFLFAPVIAPESANLPTFSLAFFVLSVLPHGVFELPAMFLAAAQGLKLGWEWLLPEARGRRWRVWRGNIADAGWLALPIIALLVVAAVIEAFVTFQLLTPPHP